MCMRLEGVSDASQRCVHALEGVCMCLDGVCMRLEGVLMRLEGVLMRLEGVLMRLEGVCMCLWCVHVSRGCALRVCVSRVC